MSKFNCLLKHETERARLVVVADREVWVPKSVTQTITKIGHPDRAGMRECIMEVLDWWADKNDL